MSEEQRIRTSQAELSLEQIAEALPGTGELMSRVGDAWWRCVYAARGGNWPLAAYSARTVRSMQRRLSILRPKYKERLEAFEAGPLAAVFTALEAQDLAAFERAFAEATDVANRMHVETGYGYLRWELPPDPPPGLRLDKTT